MDGMATCALTVDIFTIAPSMPAVIIDFRARCMARKLLVKLALKTFWKSAFETSRKSAGSAMPALLTRTDTLPMSDWIFPKSNSIKVADPYRKHR